MPYFYLSWISPGKVKNVKEAIKSHIKYITNPKRPDLVVAYNLDARKWIDLADSELKKRKNSTTTGKLLITLPNSLIKDPKKVREFVQKMMDYLNVEDYGYAVHYPANKITGKNNLHVHIVFSPRGKDGKKIRMLKKNMNAFHKFYLKTYYEYAPKKETTKKIKKVKIPRGLRPYHFHHYTQGTLRSPVYSEFFSIWSALNNAINVVRDTINDLSEPITQKRGPIIPPPAFIKFKEKEKKKEDHKKAFIPPLPNPSPIPSHPVVEYITEEPTEPIQIRKVHLIPKPKRNDVTNDLTNHIINLDPILEPITETEPKPTKHKPDPKVKEPEKPVEEQKKEQTQALIREQKQRQDQGKQAQEDIDLSMMR